MQKDRFSLLSEKQSNTDFGVYTELSDLVRLQFKAKGFSFLPKQPLQSILSGRHSSKLRGRGLNFKEIRSYFPGDDIRNMDWKVTARMRKPHIRVYSEERDRPVLFVVDQRINMFFGSRRCMKSVTGAEATAIGAWRALNTGDRIGGILFNDNKIIEFNPKRSRQHVTELLGQIVKMNKLLNLKTGIKPNPEMFNKALMRAKQIAKHDYLICLVGDGNGFNEETIHHVSSLSEHNDVISVFIYDPLEKEIPDTGKVAMAEGQQQLEINTKDHHFRNQFLKDFNDRVSRFQKISRERDIPLLKLVTSEETGIQIQKQLGNLAVGGKR